MSEIYEALIKLQAAGGEGVLATVVDKQGHGPAALQSKMLIHSNGRTLGTVGGGALERLVINKVKEILKERRGRLEKYLLDKDNKILDGTPTGMICGGQVTIFYEYVSSGLPLYIFGAGHIGSALAYHLKRLNYRLAVVDDRPELLKKIAEDEEIRTFLLDHFFEEETMPADSFVVIASYSHDLDYDILKKIYELEYRPMYIGLIASRRKRDQMLERLSRELGKNLPLDRLYCPCGLDIGGSTPAEIAISVISEIQAVHFGKSGQKHLKEAKTK